jgi:cytochrome P450
MTTAALVSDDPLYKALYDVVAEAAEVGNSVEIDVNAGLNALRERAPVIEGEMRHLLGLGDIGERYQVERRSFAILGFKECDRAFREGDIFSSVDYGDTRAPQMLGTQILTMDGDAHHRLRATAQMLFLKPKAMGWWNDNWIADASEALMGRLRTMDRSDLNLDLCARLPVHVVSVSLGIEDDQALVFRNHLLTGMGVRKATPEQQLFHFREMLRILEETIESRRADPRDDVVSGLIAADFRLPEGGTRKLTNEEVGGYARLLLLAGGGTTWRQLGITIYALLTNYHFWEACRDDRSLVDAAIEESLRWNATDPIFPRLTSQDVEIGGVSIPARSRVEICLGAANRDPERWERPDEYDIMRPFRQHLAFAIGPHHCLGQHVARQEMRVAINHLLDYFPNMRLDPDAPPPRLAGGLEQRGMSSIPVLLN